MIKNLRGIFLSIIIGWLMIAVTIILNRVCNLTTNEFVPIIVMDIITCVVLLIVSIIEYTNIES